MSVLFIAVPAALAFAVSAVIAFLWASRSGQLDDLETPPLRMLSDEDGSRAPRRGGHSSPERIHAARRSGGARN